MRILQRIAPGFRLGVLTGLIETAAVLHRQHMISAGHLALLTVEAIVIDSIAIGILILILPHRWSEFLRTRVSMIILGLARRCPMKT